MTFSPKVRRLAREKAIQFLFGLEFVDDESDSPNRGAFFEAFPARQTVRDYAEKLIDGVLEHRDELDTHIDGALKNWSASRVGKVERNVLRVALFEMALCVDVPEKVAINEAIELSKEFGGDESPRFVNGVLDRLQGTQVSSEET